MILHLERKFTSATETFIVNQINALKDREHTVFTMDYLNLLESNAQVFTPENKNKLDTYLIRKSQIKYFENQLKNVNPKIIHSHYITDAIVFSRFTKKMNIPKVCSCYGYDVSVIPIKFKWIYKKFYQRIFKEYDLFLAMTEEMKKDLLHIGCPEEKIRIHYHGINTNQFDIPRKYSFDSGMINLLTIASLYEVKGHLSVLKALIEVQKNHSEVSFIYNIVGEGPDKNKLETFVKKNNLTNSVRFHGAVKHGPEFNSYMKKADVFLHPSITTRQNDKEGIPGAIVEAMSSGLPVIATWHGGIPAVLNDGETGFLVKEHDYKAIGQKIVALYEDEDMRKRMGQAAKIHAVKNLNVFNKAQDLNEIYNFLCSNGKSKPVV